MRWLQSRSSQVPSPSSLEPIIKYIHYLLRSLTLSSQISTRFKEVCWALRDLILPKIHRLDARSRHDGVLSLDVSMLIQLEWIIYHQTLRLSIFSDLELDSSWKRSICKCHFARFDCLKNIDPSPLMAPSLFHISVPQRIRQWHCVDSWRLKVMS